MAQKAKNNSKKLGNLDQITIEGQTEPTTPEILNPPATVEQVQIVEQVANSIQFEDKNGVLTSKRFVKKALQFASPEELLRPCIDLLMNTGGKIVLEGENEQNNANTDGTVNKAFGRVNLVTTFDIDNELDVHYELGILVAYDLSVPKIKVYRGAKVKACLNLCVFNSDDVMKFDLADGMNLDTVQHFINTNVQRIQQAIEVMNRLKSIRITPNQMATIAGSMLLNTIEQKTLNGTTSILRACEMLTDSRSKYFMNQPNFNGWLLYNAFTEYFAQQGSFFDIPEKSRDTFKMLQHIAFQVNN